MAIYKNVRLSHTELVKALAKPSSDIVAEMSFQKADLIHAAMGISGEAGEILDTIKKITIYNQPLDEEKLVNLIEELGDLEFYIELLRQTIGVTRQGCIHENIRKLSKRYSSGSYSDTEAKMRRDKSTEQQKPSSDSQPSA